MKRSGFSVLAAVLALSSIANVALAACLVFLRPVPALLGQTANGGGGGFVLGTEQIAGQMPVCFVLRTQEPHLCVYELDGQGLLHFVDSRDLRCDLDVRDGHFPMNRGRSFWGQTEPPVKAICGAVGSAGSGGAKEKEKEKDSDKEKGKEKGKEKDQGKKEKIEKEKENKK